MREKPNNATADDSPYASPGFEADLIRELKGLVADLPRDAARLQIGRIPGHPEWLEPYFEVIPTNSRAAAFKGLAIKADLSLTIGEAAWREFVGFARGGTVVKGATWQEEFRWIWLAVIRGGFTVHIYRDSAGKAIGWTTKLSVNGQDLVIRNGRRAERLLGLFGRQRVERITYEPYI